jgi:hypothetical protein
MRRRSIDGALLENFTVGTIHSEWAAVRTKQQNKEKQHVWI